jgi:hypothetical protein
MHLLVCNAVCAHSMYTLVSMYLLHLLLHRLDVLMATFLRARSLSFTRNLSARRRAASTKLLLQLLKLLQLQLLELHADQWCVCRVSSGCCCCYWYCYSISCVVMTHECVLWVSVCSSSSAVVVVRCK